MAAPPLRPMAILGAFLRFNGLLGVVFQGASDNWVYLYIHDGKGELKDARHLIGKDTWETEDAIKKELGFTETPDECLRHRSGR